MKALLITGTDTGVGKTVIGCGIAAALTARGKTVGVLKPAETGCALRDGELYPEDAARLAAFARSSLPLEHICPYRFAPPVAPSVAAEQAGVTIDPCHIAALFQAIATRHEITLVEGAGGLLVPLVGRYTFADLARDLQIPIVVVVGSKLGALNHALLTFHCLQTRSLPLYGYILNHPTSASDPAIQTNARTLAGLTDIPCRGIVPFLPLRGDLEQDRVVLEAWFSQAVDFGSLLR
jgi:dethiobiotin synthetase